MPVLKYFLWVGGGLLALLLFADLYLPKPPPRTEVHHQTYHIPITSTVRVGTEPIVFSGQTRSFGPPPPMTVVDFAARPNKTQDHVKQANAAMTGKSEAAEQRAKPEPRKKVAKRKIRRQQAPDDRDFAHVPDGWRRDQPTGLAFARPFFW
jgi:hypothetical protein